MGKIYLVAISALGYVRISVIFLTAVAEEGSLFLLIFLL